MRRKEREITDIEEMLGIFDGCSTMHVAFTDRDGPYVVPVSFGYSFQNGVTEIYFHCAKTGKKLDCLSYCGRVCFACDTFSGYEKTEAGITARYSSVIGYGKCEELEKKSDIVRALERITAHCGYPDYPVESCGALDSLTVCRITAESMTGKANPPHGT